MRLRLTLAWIVAALVVPSVAGAALNGRVGPGPSISLKRNGAIVNHLPPGSYTFVIRDRSSNHNFHLRGPGVNKKTRVAFIGRKRWRGIQLSSGTYRYLCDVHPFTMRRNFSVG